MLGLAACSPDWKASMRLQGVGAAGQRQLAVTVESAIGDRFQGALVGGCVDVRVPQSPKLPNRIAITIADAGGRVVGRAATNDLANQPFTIALDGGAAVAVTPNAACASAPPPA